MRDASGAHRWLAAATVALIGLGPPQAALSQTAPPDGPRHFDIPAGPLELALSRFAEVSGVDVLYSQPIATARRSTPVVGDLAAPQALTVLLEGTGLSSRFTSPRSVVVFVPAAQTGAPEAAHLQPSGDSAALDLDPMRVTAPRLIGRSGPDPFREYAIRAERDIRRSLDAARLVVGGQSYQTRISARVLPDGSLEDVRILRPGQDRLHDSQIVAQLRALRLTTAPPPDMPQPLIFDVQLQ